MDTQSRGSKQDFFSVRCSGIPEKRIRKYRRNRKKIDGAKFDGFINQAKEYANLAYLVGILGDIPQYVQRMDQIVKSNAYVRSVLEHHPDPIRALSCRFCGVPDRDSGEYLDRGSLQSGACGNASRWGSLAAEGVVGLFHVVRKDLDAFIAKHAAGYKQVNK